MSVVAVAPRGHTAGGFTFVETLIAMALLAFIVGDLAMVSIASSRSGVGARHLGLAVSLAENAIEHSRNADFNKLDLPANPLTEHFSFRGEPVAGPGSFFARTRTVTPLPGGALAAARSADVVVVVSWVDARGEAQQFRLASVVSRF